MRISARILLAAGVTLLALACDPEATNVGQRNDAGAGDDLDAEPGGRDRGLPPVLDSGGRPDMRVRGGFGDPCD